MLTETSRRQDFPGLIDRVYLNTAAEGIPPRAVADAVATYLADKQLGMDGRIRHEAQWLKARNELAALLRLTVDEVGICGSTSEAFNSLALALRLQPGDEVIINDLDFPSGITPWLPPISQVTAKLWRAKAGELHLDDLKTLLTPRTRLVSTSLVSFYNGYQINVPEVAEVVRQHSPGLLAVDVTQALGRVPLNLAGADFIVSSTYKWLLGIHGGGIVGVPQRRAAELTVPAGGWFNLQAAFGPERFERAEPLAGAGSFTPGMPNYAAVYAIAAAGAYLNGIGVATIHTQTKPLVEACLRGLQQLSLEMLTPAIGERLAGIIAFRHPRADLIHDSLHGKNIHIMHNAGRLRVAIHGYNTMNDIEQFLAAIHHVLREI